MATKKLKTTKTSKEQIEIFDKNKDNTKLFTYLSEIESEDDLFDSVMKYKGELEKDEFISYYFNWVKETFCKGYY